jgi:cation diffusion facilitator CzcD-associated flavoprotein CzcO
VTQAAVAAIRDVVILGDGSAGQAMSSELLAAGITDIARPIGEVASSRFDDDAHTWELRTAPGESVRARVVIATDPSVFVGWTPELLGCNDFRGDSFHASRWRPGFDPAGKRIAVIGTDASAGHYLQQLIESACTVTIFAHAPRRFVAEIPLPSTRVKRWLRRHTPLASRDRRPRPALVAAAISAITASGIRTDDGVEHDADAIIYGTGFTIADHAPDLVGTGGLAIKAALDDGAEPFLGVALHGFPNYFWVTGPDVGAQARYVAQCLGLMKRTGSTRIEVRRSSQQVFSDRAHVGPAQPFQVSSAFDLSSAATPDNETYDGEATLTIAGACHPVRVRLSGHLDPIDGRYHWQGTVFSSPSQPLTDEVLKQSRTAMLTVGERTAPARITEQTPWGTHSLAGVGAPPYALSGR